MGLALVLVMGEGMRLGMGTEFVSSLRLGLRHGIGPLLGPQLLLLLLAWAWAWGRGLGLRSALVLGPGLVCGWVFVGLWGLGGAKIKVEEGAWHRLGVGPCGVRVWLGRFGPGFGLVAVGWVFLGSFWAIFVSFLSSAYFQVRPYSSLSSKCVISASSSYTSDNFVPIKAGLPHYNADLGTPNWDNPKKILSL